MKLNLICANDALRPVMSYVKVTKDVMVATDAHVLGVVPTSKLFDDDFISKIPEGGMLIHKDDFAKIISGTNTVWKGDGVLKIIVKNKRDILVETETEDNIGKYPYWEAIIPTEKDRLAQLNAIGVNFELASSLQKALGFYSSKLTFSGVSKAIYVTDSTEKDEESYGVIMPVNIK